MTLEPDDSIESQISLLLNEHERAVTQANADLLVAFGQADIEQKPIAAQRVVDALRTVREHIEARLNEMVNGFQPPPPDPFDD